jgi:hypothetical protein
MREQLPRVFGGVAEAVDDHIGSRGQNPIDLPRVVAI